MRRDVFQAIADPTRREIIYMLADKKLTINMITENFRISRPAISKHIKILSECGIITISQFGRERYCKINIGPLKEVYNWLEYFDQYWNKKLNSLKNYAEGK